MPGTTPTYGLRYAELGDAPDGAALGQNLADDVEAELERIDTAAGALAGVDAGTRLDALEASWSSAPGQWTAGTTNPNVGAAGFFDVRRLIVGHTVHFHATLQVSGTGWSLGNGSYRFVLPEPPLDPLPGAFAAISQGPNRQYTARFTPESELVIYMNGHTTIFDAAEAATEGWGSGTWLGISGTYEIA